LKRFIDVPLLDWPNFDVDLRSGTASAGQAVPMCQKTSFCPAEAVARLSFCGAKNFHNQL
jgi:hypothetical protein